MPLRPAMEYRIRPREAATSTMQMAMNIVEMRIMSRSTPPKNPVGSLASEQRERLFADVHCAPPSSATLASMLIRRASVLLVRPERRGQCIGHGGVADADRRWTSVGRVHDHL